MTRTDKAKNADGVNGAERTRSEPNPHTEAERVPSEGDSKTGCHFCWGLGTIRRHDGGLESCRVCKGSGLAAISPERVPEGGGGDWVLVPREPTREMWAAAGDAFYGIDRRKRPIISHDLATRAMWDAMLAALTPPLLGLESHSPHLAKDAPAGAPLRPVEQTSGSRVPDYSTSGRYTSGPFAIVNRHGNFWSHDTYMSVEAAWTKLNAFWAGKPEMLDGFRVVPVVVAISELCSGAEQPLASATDASGEAGSLPKDPATPSDGGGL